MGRGHRVRHRAASGIKDVFRLTSLDQNPQHSCILGSSHIISGILLREGKGVGLVKVLFY